MDLFTPLSLVTPNPPRKDPLVLEGRALWDYTPLYLKWSKNSNRVITINFHNFANEGLMCHSWSHHKVSCSRWELFLERRNISMSFFYKIVGSVCSNDSLLMMLVLIVKCIADMRLLQGDWTFCRTCVGWLSFDVLLRIPRRGFEEGWLHCK